MEDAVEWVSNKVTVVSMSYRILQITNDTLNTRYDNVTLIPLVLQLGLRIGLIQRMGEN